MEADSKLSIQLALGAAFMAQILLAHFLDVITCDVKLL